MFFTRAQTSKHRPTFCSSKQEVWLEGQKNCFCWLSENLEIADGQLILPKQFAAWTFSGKSLASVGKCAQQNKLRIWWNQEKKDCELAASFQTREPRVGFLWPPNVWQNMAFFELLLLYSTTLFLNIIFCQMLPPIIFGHKPKLSHYLVDKVTRNSLWFSFRKYLLKNWKTSFSSEFQSMQGHSLGFFTSLSVWRSLLQTIHNSTGQVFCVIVEFFAKEKQFFWRMHFSFLGFLWNLVALTQSAFYGSWRHSDAFVLFSQRIFVMLFQF